ncbi:MAG: hypothetical protein FJZ38_18295 [Candidatus Rokubacteria bacterium]|nr:hypothetical protein [Candidatus Rokubacteria bacterium]
MRSAKPVVGLATHWVYFTEQWDPKSPWHDRRVRLAANHAIDRQAINQADALGHARVNWSIVPPSFDFYWQPPGYGFDPGRARQLLAEAGYPNGFEAGDYFCDAAITNIGEPVVNYLNAAGIRVKLRPIERAAYFKGFAEKKYKGLIHGASGAFGNAATRVEAFVAGGGTYAYGSDTDLDGLVREQGRRAGSPAPGRDPRAHPATHAREGDVRADPPERRHDGLRAEGGGVRARGHRRLSVVRALRGPEAEGQVRRSNDRLSRHLR